eukprot:gene6251-2878_t
MLLSRRFARAPVRAPPSSRRPVKVLASASVKPGDSVQVHFKGSLDSGDEFDSSFGKEPLAFTLGSGQCVLGGSPFTVERTVACYVTRLPMNPKSPLAFTLGSGQVVKGLEGAITGLAVGDKKTIRLEPSDAYDKITKEEIIFDLNHELAGQALTFEVEIVNRMEAGRIQKAYFGAGCFWSVELMFQRVPGVIKTAVGYCNGITRNPTYDEVCTGKTGHAEVVEVVFDTQQVSFPELLDMFFDKHDPTTPDRAGNDVGSQYRSGLYYTTPEQQEDVVKAIEKRQWAPPLLAPALVSFLGRASPTVRLMFSPPGDPPGRVRSAQAAITNLCSSCVFPLYACYAPSPSAPLAVGFPQSLPPPPVPSPRRLSGCWVPAGSVSALT